MNLPPHTPILAALIALMGYLFGMLIVPDILGHIRARKKRQADQEPGQRAPRT